MSVSEDKRLRVLEKCRSDPEWHARHCLFIQKRDGTVGNLIYNECQKALHALAQEQLKEHGRVRIIVNKSRKDGVSTYVASRFYNHTSLFSGVNTFVVGHDDTAHSTLFGITKHFYDNDPIAPEIQSRNESELRFANMNSGYRVGIAGQKAGKGRSMTIHRLHLSEFAFYDNARAHLSALTAAIPQDAPGTEIFIESTANGPAGEFYERWNAAVAGEGMFKPFFWPWFKSSWNRVRVPRDFEIYPHEREYAEMFNLDNEQIMFMRSQIELLGDERIFHQEFPATPEMSFQDMGDGEIFIDGPSVINARKNTIEPPDAYPVILGVDPASSGRGDRFAICARKGQKVLFIKQRRGLTQDEAIEWVRHEANEVGADYINVDAGNIGVYLIQSLRALGPTFLKRVRSVDFAAKSQWKMATPELPGPKNRRAEMWDRMRKFLLDETGADIPDIPELQADLLAPRKKRVGSDFLLESKDDMKRRGVRSPDLADSMALTFAYRDEYTIGADAGSFKRKKKRERELIESFNEKNTPWDNDYSWLGY